MASLAQRNGRFRVVFRYDGEKYTLSLKTSNEKTANASLARLEDNLRRLELGTLAPPDDADLASFLLGNGDFETDPSDDIGLLTNWLESGERGLLLAGDNVASWLGWSAGSAGQQFLTQHVGVTVVDSDLRPLIGEQTAPLVRTVPGNGVVVSLDRWIAYGGCLRINRFDAVEVAGGTTRVAEFTDPAGNQGVYSYAAVSAREHPTTGSRVVLLPYDFAVAPDAPLRVTLYPNPFNPRTTIALDLPRAGEVQLRIYDLRGALVRTLVDERLEAGRHEVVWDGTDGRGAAVASGVYFSELRAAGETRIGKLALVR